MTQHGFEGPERIAATLDAMAEALLGEQATHYPVAALSGFRPGGEPFGLRISPRGPGLLTVHGLGTIVECGTAHRARPDGGPAAVSALMARYGGGTTVRGRTLANEVPSAADFQLPVTPEAADQKLRPEFVPALAALAEDRGLVLPEELATGSGVEARVLVPSVFHPLTVRGGGGPLAEHLAEVAEELFAGADIDARRDLAVIAAGLTEEIRTAGVVFAGLAALQVDDRRSHASLVISLTRSQLSASDLASALAIERPNAEVWAVLLPAGPAALLVEPRTAPVPSGLTGGQRRWAVSSVAEAFLPLPDGVSLLTLQLSTVQPDDWELYAEAFARILEGVRIGWDGVRPDPSGAPAEPAVAIPSQAVDTAPRTPAEPTAVAAVQSADPFVPASAPEAAPKDQGTTVAVSPADFDPFAPPAQSATAAGERGSAVATELASLDPFAAPSQSAPAAESPGKGTAVNVPPADFDPFAPPAPVPAAATAEPAAASKGTAVNVPPADFDPFAPPAPSAPSSPAAGSAPGKGTAVNVPPADFNPFGASSAPSAPSAPAAPAPVAQAPAPKADPFGTKITNEPQDPFGTVTKPSGPASPPPPAAAPVIPPPPSAPPTVGKATPVNVPPADFNPFAPPAPATTAAAAEEPPAPGKGTPVNVPPADFNPFGASAPSAPSAPAQSPTPEPPATSPFG